MARTRWFAKRFPAMRMRCYPGATGIVHGCGVYRVRRDGDAQCTNTAEACAELALQLTRRPAAVKVNRVTAMERAALVILSRLGTLTHSLRAHAH